jgi:hypothetical protein
MFTPRQTTSVRRFHCAEPLRNRKQKDHADADDAFHLRVPFSVRPCASSPSKASRGNVSSRGSLLDQAVVVGIAYRDRPEVTVVFEHNLDPEIVDAMNNHGQVINGMSSNKQYRLAEFAFVGVVPEEEAK